MTFRCIAMLPSDSITLNNKRLGFMIVGGSVLHATSMTGLYFAWYKDYDRSAFHWFDDSGEWLQMDKPGHIFSAYYLNQLSYELAKWSGIKTKNSTILGACSSFIVMSGIEIFDGFSTKWGASWSDLLANLAGATIFTSQQYIWKEQKIIIKFSFHETQYECIRPDVLGRNYAERVIKDYNGETFWLSGNLHSLSGLNFLPEWLCLSFGYGAEGMTGGIENVDIAEINPTEFREFKRIRQYYLSLDIDLSKINFRSKTLKIIAQSLNCIKFPFPTLEYNDSKFRIHALYF
ncbi:MAG: DUF2279 domain-containing protein [Bacteroidia bacterium]|nr:DUF2279 domain-containing protein [Bacteroidia bacterium]